MQGRPAVKKKYSACMALLFTRSVFILDFMFKSDGRP